MEDKSFEINPRVVWILALASISLFLLRAFAQFYHWSIAGPLVTVSLMFSFGAWIIIMVDLLQNRVYQKTFWVILMFILPIITPLFYLYMRAKLHRMGQRVG